MIFLLFLLWITFGGTSPSGYGEGGYGSGGYGTSGTGPEPEPQSFNRVIFYR